MRVSNPREGESSAPLAPGRLGLAADKKKNVSWSADRSKRQISGKDRERFERIKRQANYGCTLKDLAWLIRLIDKLLKGSAVEDAAKVDRFGGR